MYLFLNKTFNGKQLINQSFDRQVFRDFIDLFFIICKMGISAANYEAFIFHCAHE